MSDVFRCEYCGKGYRREGAFLRHRCVEMERSELMNTTIGQSAFNLYTQWWKTKRRMPPSAEQFKQSSQFNAMISFAEFVRRTKLNVKVYLDLVVRYDLSPDAWTRDDVYVKYLEYIDKTVSCEDQIKISVDYIMKLADVIECDTSEVFEMLTSTEVQQLIRDRKLSPWLLLHSKAFKVWLIKQPDQIQLDLQNLIRPMYWKLRFNKESNGVTFAKKVTKALGI